MMLRAKRFTINTVCNAISQIAGLICGFATTKIILLLFQSEVSGFIMSVSQFNSYFNFAVSGMTAAAIFALFKPLAQKDTAGINGIISHVRQYYNLGAWIIAGINLMIAAFYPVFIPSDVITPADMRVIILLIASCSVIELAVASKYSVLILADQGTFLISIASTVSYIVQFMLSFLLYQLMAPAVIFCFVYLAASTVRTLIPYVYIKIKYKQADFKTKPIKSWAKKQRDALFIQGMNFLQTVLPLSFATVFTNLKSVRVYSTYNIVIIGIQALFYAFVSSITSLLGDMIARNEKEMLRKTFRSFEFAFYSIVTIIYSATFVSITYFMNLYTSGVDDNNFNQPILGVLFVVSSLFTTLQIPQTALVQSSGLFKETKWSAVIQIIILCIVSVLAAPRFGLLGIAAAAAIANLYRNTALLAYVPKKVTGLRTKGRFIRQIRVVIEICTITVPVFIIRFKVDTIRLWLLFAVGMVIYSSIVTLIGAFLFERKELKNIYSTIKLYR